MGEGREVDVVTLAIPPSTRIPHRSATLCSREAARTAAAIGAFIPPVVLFLLRERGARRPTSTASAPGLHAVRRITAYGLRLLGVTVDVIGRDRVPAQGGIVFMWNQESHLDHLILPVAMPRPFFSLFNNEVKRTPLYGSHMERSGHIWVDRTDEAQWRAAIARAAERVREGACVLVSPEGTRSWDGRLGEMKRGAFELACKAERPIVCVTFIGTHERMPRGSMVVRPGPVRVVLSEPIPVGPDEDIDGLKAEVARVLSGTKEAVLRAGFQP
jgi:1-acyl-sn-glycerol-3-phosphate acyltransferase